MLAMTSGFASMVTGPLNKETLSLEGHSSPGNTEVLAALSGAKNYAMMLSQELSGHSHLYTCFYPKDLRPDKNDRVLRTKTIADEAFRNLEITSPRIASPVSILIPLRERTARHSENR